MRIVPPQKTGQRIVLKRRVRLMESRQQSPHLLNHALVMESVNR